jgi:signal transduction histidine kinase
MVKNYLDLSRLERGVLEAHIAPIELKREVVDIALNHVQGLFESRGVTLEVSMPESLEVEADPALLRIVLSNYLSNAAKYGREGGRARLTIECDGDLVRGLVWNEGGGFTEEERQQLFQQFKRLQNETTRGRKGSGLGLFLCRHIMELHGGRVWARSEPGAWAEFGFEMPQRRAAEASEAAAVR